MLARERKRKHSLMRCGHAIISFPHRHPVGMWGMYIHVPCSLGPVFLFIPIPTIVALWDPTAKPLYYEGGSFPFILVSSLKLINLRNHLPV